MTEILGEQKRVNLVNFLFNTSKHAINWAGDNGDKIGVNFSRDSIDFGLHAKHAKNMSDFMSILDE